MMNIFKRKKHIILCIHGFGSRRKLEYDNFELWFNKDKYNIETFNLFDPNNIEDNDYTKWVLKAEEKIIYYTNLNYKIDLIGYSMGGVIAASLSTKYNINRLILLAPAYNYFHIDNISKYIINKGKKLISSETSNKHLPESFYSGFTSLIKNLKSDISKVNTPTLIIHGNIDEVIPLKSSTDIIKKIPTTNKRLIILNDGHHRLIQDKQVNYECYQICKLFLEEKILPNTPIETIEFNGDIQVNGPIKAKI